MSLPALLGGSPRTLGEGRERGWLNRRQIGRLCSLLTQGWCAQAHFQSPAAVRFRTSRRKKHSQSRSELGRRSFVGQSICVSSVFAHTVPHVFSLFLFAPGLWAWSVRVMAFWWSHSSHSQGHLRDIADASLVAKFLDNLV